MNGLSFPPYGGKGPTTSNFISFSYNLMSKKSFCFKAFIGGIIKTAGPGCFVIPTPLIT